MREIKFRAWAGEKMTESCNLWDRGDSPIEWLNNLPYPDSILMQYTGLKDKNGKEIYEGDRIFIEGHRGLGLYYSVCYTEGMWRLEGSEEAEDDFLTNFSADELEVIGNIYENPELVGKAKE